jgi:hypothetical protein
MTRIKDKLIQLSYHFTFFSIWWYSLTMRFTRKIGTNVKKYNNLEDIPKAFDFGRKYRWDQLFGSKADHLTHPTRLQWRIDNDFEFGDCDDHAVYWCAALLKSKLAKRVWFAFYSMKKQEPINKTSRADRMAHAVCVFQGLDDTLYWCDYNNPKKIEDISMFMYESASTFGYYPVAGVICHIDKLKDDDTPKFGKRTVFKA